MFTTISASRLSAGSIATLWLIGLVGGPRLGLFTARGSTGLLAQPPITQPGADR